ncbi:MAG: hypothetical protein GWO24_22665, partial [Akkermansiaceae bacterium]|nr:hypothetical protein [Akkermansiaceae bacterium]
MAKIPDVLQTVTGAAVAVLESDWAAKVGSAFLKPIELAEDTIGAVFKGLFTTPIKAVTLLTKGMVALGTAGARAGVQFGSFVRGMVTVENITKTFGRDGLLGVLLGPLAPLLRLLSPIIDMLVEGLMPA